MALAIGLVAGGLITAVFHRAGETVAYLDRQADVRVTDAGGREVSVPPDRALRRGQRVHVGARPANVSLAGGGNIYLRPQARLSLTGGGVEARLDAGVAIVDTTTVVRQVRIDTAAGRIVLTAARVELRASVSLPSGPGGGPAFAYLHVEGGSVRLESARGSLTLESEEGGLLVAGRPPVRRPDLDAAAALTPLWPPQVASEPPPPPSPMAATASSVVVPVAVPVAVTEGSITGVVEMDGFPPREATRTASCAAAGAPPWAVAAGRVAGVYVHITSTVPSPSPPAPLPAQASQWGCAVLPRVMAVLVGRQVALQSSDGAAHGARITQGPQVVFETRLGPGAAPAVWTPSREGMYMVRCDVHPEAAGVVAVSAHPFFAVTGSDGSFVIPQVSAGRHTVTAWHELGGEKSAEVTVSPGRVAEVRFRYAGDPLVAAVAAPDPAAPMLPPPQPDPAPPIRSGITECEIAVAGTSPVARACAEGGVERATGLMKQIVATARQRGERVRCQGCHQRVSRALLAGAREELDHLLAGPQIVTYVVRPPLLTRAAGTRWRGGGRNR
jgi:hypothetical protein